MKEGSHNKTQRVKLSQSGPPTCPAIKNSGGQREEGHGIVHHVQCEHHQSYLLHHYRNASIQGRQIQCRKDQMQVSHVEKNMVEQSSTVPNSESIILILSSSGPGLGSRSGPGQVQVRSRSGPRSGPKGPRTKDQRPGLTLRLY